jgi:hypothetical protein
MLIAAKAEPIFGGIFAPRFAGEQSPCLTAKLATGVTVLAEGVVNIPISVMNRFVEQDGVDRPGIGD